MGYERKHIVGNAAETSLDTSISDSDLSLVLDDATNYPTGGASGKFVLAVGWGLATEEKVLCTSRSGTTVTISARGHDGTTAQAHSAGAPIAHVLDAETIDQVNRYVNLQDSKGDIVLHNGTNATVLANTSVDDTDDGHVMQKSWAAATGWALGRLVTILLQSGAPTVAGYVRMWYDTTNRILRPSDGSSWIVPVQAPNVADATARGVLFSDPQKGHMCHRDDYDLLEWYDGAAWRPVGVPKFATTTARDTYDATPADGDQAYVLDIDSQFVYRGTEWVRISQKVTVAASQPASPIVGDTWFQPID